MLTKRNLLYVSIAAIVLPSLGFFLNSSLISYLAYLAALIMGLVITFRAKQWLWLILTIFFTPLVTLIYSLIG